MNRNTGFAIDGVQHLRQSILDILTTPLGSRVMRRSYGSLIPALLDQPMNAALASRINAAAAAALMRWEPRLHIRRVRFSPVTHTAGHGSLHIDAVLRIAAIGTRPLSLEVAL